MNLGEWGDGEDLREVVKMGTVNKMYCMKINKKSVFSLRKKRALAASAENQGSCTNMITYNRLKLQFQEPTHSSGL